MIYCALQHNVVMMILTKNPAPEIRFKKIKFVRGSELKPFLPHPEKVIAEQVRGAAADLKANMMEEDSPYADDQGKVALLCNEKIAKEAKTKAGLILRLREFLLDERSVGFADSIVLEDELVTAGKLLTQRSRADYPVCILAHGMEPVMLGVSMLRMMGMETYPAIAKSEGYTEPVIALIGLYGIPLSTISFGESHPPMRTLQLISDMAMRGVTYAMLAENQVRRFFRDMAWLVSKGASELPAEEVSEYLDLIVEPLYKSYCLWPQNQFIHDTLIGLGTKMFHLLHAVGMNRATDAEEDAVKEASMRCAAGIASKAEDVLNTMLGCDPQDPN